MPTQDPNPRPSQRKTYNHTYLTQRVAAEKAADVHQAQMFRERSGERLNDTIEATHSVL